MARSAYVENRQGERCAHEDHRRPAWELREHVGRCARTECGLRTLATKGACEVSRAALLQQDDSNQKQADDEMNTETEEEENCIASAAFQDPSGLTGSANSLVRRRGLEPLCLAALAPQASASANFATSARGEPIEYT